MNNGLVQSLKTQPFSIFLHTICLVTVKTSFLIVKVIEFLGKLHNLAAQYFALSAILHQL